MSNFRQWLFVVSILLPACTFGDESEVPLHGSMECPSKSDLNATSLHWHLRREDSVFFDARHADARSRAGLHAQYSEKDLVELKTSRDKSVCASLNKRFRDLWIDKTWDREKERHAPSYFSIYYRIGDRYVVISSPYSPGDSKLEQVGGPSGGVTAVTIFDEDLNEIGSFSL